VGSRLLAVLLALVLALCAPTFIQAAVFGSVHIVVRDSQDHLVTGARIELTSASSAWSRIATSDARGEALFATVPIGDYALSVSRPGFAVEARAITIVSGSALTAGVELSTGPILQPITISAMAEASTETATPTTLVNQDDIERTPGADRSNSLAMITDFVPGTYFVHDQLHVRGGHQTSWEVDGVEIPNTNIADNLGPQIDPKDIDTLETERGSYEADQGDRTYGVFNVVPKTGLGRENEAQIIATGGNFGQTNDYASIASHSDELAYYLSANGNRSDLGLQTPTAAIIHDAQNGYGGFGTVLYDAGAADQLRLVSSVRHDDYDIPNTPGQIAADVQRETDAFSILSWIHTLETDTVLTSSLFFHYNQANLDGAPNDYPISTTDQRSSIYVGGQQTLRFAVGDNQIRTGLLGFYQHDTQLFDVLFNDGSSTPFAQTQRPSGGLVAAYIEDSYRCTPRLQLMGGLRETYFAASVTENATNPRLGFTYQIPGVEWVLRGFYGTFYQAPPLSTVSGPLLAYAQSSNLGFIPLRGERDKEWQLGLAVPLYGWTLDLDYFRTRASNFFDHDAVGNSNVFLPLTIQGALIHAAEFTLRSPRLWSFGQVHLAYSNQVAQGIGAVSGGLTDFSPPAGYFGLDHDQRNTVNAGFDANLPWRAFAAANLYYGSGFSNGEGAPSHLPSHASLDLTLGKAVRDNLSASVTLLNAANKHLLIDNSLTFGGFHYDNPREIYGEIRYKFNY
jgi:TonB dependent receptor/Carboxypeptidase regulatory-like domain/TonB-dependent Receptor Plug Domain